ncbi:MAG: DNA polymerase III subunit alpha, partial [Planctomycetes bacterium]|nr:DNA polymerase III subunit alpha [Planctomycetota bacterium]
MPDPSSYHKRPHPGKPAPRARTTGSSSRAIALHRRYAELHCKSNFSFLRGASHPDELTGRAVELGYDALAITDRNTLAGVVRMHEAAKSSGIKLIIGAEITPVDAPPILLYATDRASYGRLARIITQGRLRVTKGSCSITLADIDQWNHGLIAVVPLDGFIIPHNPNATISTSADRNMNGNPPLPPFMSSDQHISSHIHQPDIPPSAVAYFEIFSRRLYWSVSIHGGSNDAEYLAWANSFACASGVPLVATNDVHYLEHDDVEAHDVLCCINTGKLLTDTDRFKFDSDQFYFKSPEEMAGLFPDYPEAIANTILVADMCELEIDLSKRHAPVFRVPEAMKVDLDVKAGEAEDAALLRKKVYEGAAERYETITDELRERIDYELEVITSKGFASYFLIVWDCVNYAREHGIPVGARGSGCSSVVAHCLYISTPDPIRYGLYFERFMDPDRDEMPDIDLDICQIGRADLLEYVRKKYEHVAQIITFGTLKAKAAIKDVARVMGMGFEEANKLTKLIPNELKMTLDKALDREPELRKLYNENELVHKIIDVARRLEGVARNAGIHAAGVVVADEPLVNLIPLYKAPDQSTVVTQFDGPTVEAVGLLKMDFLGLRTLTILERARQLAERSAGKPVNIDHLDLTDAKVFALFARGNTKGIFQFESGGMRDVIMRMKPNRIEDLIAANALFRPGPMEYIPEYIARKHGQKWTTPHPIMTEVLQETYGIMVYQEQVSRLVNRLGGIELKAAFRLAKAISKKKTSMIEAMREPFLAGCAANGVSRDTAGEVFADILKFGGYAFNKAHSTGYALVAYQTAWMKSYFPVEFMAAVMTFEMSSIEKVAEYREACREMGIEIRPPGINTSEYDFIVEQAAAPVGSEPRARATGDPERQASACANSAHADVAPTNDLAQTANDATAGVDRVIRFGLGAIKGVGAKAVLAIVDERKNEGPYEDLFDFCERVDLTAVNRAATEALICAGAFDGTGVMRKALVDALDRAVAGGQAVQRDRRSGQMGLFGAEPQALACADSPGANSRAAGASVPGPLLTTAEWSEAEMLAREKAVLGFYITKHPLSSHERLIEACATAKTVDLGRFDDGTEVVVGGMVSSLRTVVTRSGRNAGKRLGIVTFEDLTGRVEAVVFPDDLVKYRSHLVPDKIVFLEGTVDRKREEPSLRVSRVVPAEEAVTALDWT